MSKKPRKAKNSNKKRLTLMSQYIMKNMAIVYTLQEKATFIDIKTLKIVPANPTLVNAAKEIQHTWRVYISVMLENQIGEQYVKINDCSPERRCYQEDVLDCLNEEHVKLTNSTKLADRVNLGWVAIPSGQELTERKIVELLECLPCWGVFERGEIKTETDKQRGL